MFYSSIIGYLLSTDGVGFCGEPWPKERNRRKSAVMPEDGRAALCLPGFKAQIAAPL